MLLSARNKLKGVVKGIEKGEVAVSVKIEISGPATITSMITKVAAEDLGLKVERPRCIIRSSGKVASQ
jgi:molybdate transport system regulatory protein